MSTKLIRISKYLSYLLRHGGAEEGITIDKHGYASLNEVLSILKRRYPEADRATLATIVAEDEKGRYEIADDRIRARYGHSIEVAAKVEASEPPEVLYHGTAGRTLPMILRDGLMPMTRQFVHLSITPDDARTVGRRRSPNVVVLKIRAHDAYEDGVVFYRESDTYLARAIPPDYIEVTDK